MKNNAIKKQIVCFLCVVCAVALLVGCTLPTYNLAMDGTPSQGLDKFMRAVMDGENDKIRQMLYNYTWDAASVSDSESFGKNDRAVLECLRTRRSYRIADGSERTVDSHHATVGMEYSTFDIGKFQDELSRKVVAEVQRQQFEGTVFEETNEIDPIVEEIKSQLLEQPQRFQTTASFDVEMISHQGRWKVVLTDELYSALTGYAV